MIKKIPGFSRYSINTEGVVKNIRTSKVIKICDRAVYKKVTLTCDSGNIRSLTLHRALALTFIPNPRGLPIVRHLNDDPKDNRLVNLAWGTWVDNSRDRAKNNMIVSSNRVLSKRKVREIFKSELSQRALAKKYKVSHSVIGYIKRRKTYKEFTSDLEDPKPYRRPMSYEDVIAIFKSNERQIDLADKYGVSDSTICLIKKRKRYADITNF